MKLIHIRHLVAVAERGVMASASELGVSRHVLIRSIRALEREFGTALFKRGKQSMTLTPIGEMFVRRAAAAQRELDRASDEISRTPGSSTGLVAIGLSASPHVALLPEVLRSFQLRFADVRLRIVEGVFATLEREVRSGILDFYVGPVCPHQCAGLKVARLGGGDRIVVGRAGHPLAGATSLAQLADARWIATSRRALDPLFEQHRLPRPVVVVEAATGLSMLSAVVSSDGLLLLAASWLPLVERTGLLSVLPVAETLDFPAIHMVTRSELPLAPAAAYLHELIVQASTDP